MTKARIGILLPDFPNKIYSAYIGADGYPIDNYQRHRGWAGIGVRLIDCYNNEIAAMELCKGGNICWMDDNEPLKTMGNTFSYSLDEWFSPERIEDYSYLFMWGSWYYRH